MAGGGARRPVGAAAFVLLCAPCSVGFLAFLAPAMGAALVGFALLPSVSLAVALGGAALGYHAWTRRRLRRLAAGAAPKRLDGLVSAR